MDSEMKDVDRWLDKYELPNTHFMLRTQHNILLHLANIVVFATCFPLLSDQL